MSGPAIGRAALEEEERAKTQRVAELAQALEALERRLEQVRQELAQEVGGLTTLRGILGTPVEGDPNGDKPKRKRK